MIEHLRGLIGRVTAIERELERRRYEVPPPHAVSHTMLGSDVNLGATGTLTAVFSLALSPGTWRVEGSVTVVDTTGAATFSLLVSDGSTNQRSTSITTGAGNWEGQMSFDIASYTTAGSPTMTLYAKDHTSGTGKAKAASTFAAGGNNACWMSATRIG